MSLRVGLTGGIGSGKSTVAALLAGHGAAVIDADAIARELTAPGGAAIEALRAEFGAAAIDAGGALDRAWMRRRAFSDAGAKARLEALLHPMIRAAMRRSAGAATELVVVLDIPLLAEPAGGAYALDRVLVVDCPPALQLARLAADRGLAAAEARAIMAQQIGREQRLAIASDVVVNAAARAALAPRIARLYGLYCDLARKRVISSPR